MFPFSSLPPPPRRIPIVCLYSISLNYALASLILPHLSHRSHSILRIPPKSVKQVEGQKSGTREYRVPLGA